MSNDIHNGWSSLVDKALSEFEETNRDLDNEGPLYEVLSDYTEKARRTVESLESMEEAYTTRQKEQETLRASLDQEKFAWDSDLAERESTLEEKRAAIQKAESQHEDTMSRHTTELNDIVRMINEKKDELQREKAAFEKEVSTYEESQWQWKELTRLATSNENLTSEIQGLREHGVQHTEQLSRLTTFTENLPSQLQGLRDSGNQHTAQYTQLQTEREEMLKKISRLEAENAEHTKRSNQQLKSSGITVAEKARLEETMDQLETQVGELKHALAESRKLSAERLEDKGELRSRLHQVISERDRLTEEQHGHVSEIEALKTRLASLQESSTQHPSSVSAPSGLTDVNPATRKRVSAATDNSAKRRKTAQSTESGPTAQFTESGPNTQPTELGPAQPTELGATPYGPFAIEDVLQADFGPEPIPASIWGKLRFQMLTWTSRRQEEWKRGQIKGGPVCAERYSKHNKTTRTVAGLACDFCKERRLVCVDVKGFKIQLCPVDSEADSNVGPEDEEYWIGKA